MENRIKIVCTFHNVKDYILECIESILRQKYNNWYCVLIDNSSDDGTFDILPHNDPRFIIIKSDYRTSPLACDIRAFEHNYHLDEINLVLCGDDKLLGDYALTIINNIYNDNPNVKLTHGQYIDSNGRLGTQTAYTRFRFHHLRRLGMCCGENCNNCTFPMDNQLGKGGWDFNASHIKTFKSSLYREFKELDPHYDSFKHNGEWINHSADVFYMTPFMEICGFNNIYFNEIPIYWWRLHDKNEVSLKLDRDKQPLINLKRKIK